MPLSIADEAELKRLIENEARALAREFAGAFDRETIDRFVRESFEALDEQRSVTNFVPALVRRHARERLKALADGGRPSQEP